ncbi:MAG: hypothetical protein F6K31_38765 [Symploca sp. SIO2G7]|nr:hypothetical protein [Symploca sp. SIO2G7]
MKHDTIELYEPINILKQVGEDIWLVDGSIVKMSIYGTKIPWYENNGAAELRRAFRWLE